MLISMSFIWMQYTTGPFKKAPAIKQHEQSGMWLISPSAYKISRYNCSFIWSLNSLKFKSLCLLLVLIYHEFILASFVFCVLIYIES